MTAHSWAEIGDPLVEQLAAWLDSLKQLDVAGELQELAQLVAAAELDANLLAAVALYVLPLLWLGRRWRRGGLLAVLGGVVRLFVVMVMVMFVAVALLGRLEGRSYRW